VVHGFGDVSRLFRIETAGLSFTDRAEAAMTRADVAAEHERRGAVGPTLENVWTTSFLTNSVQVESFDQLQHLVLIRWIAQTDAQPFGLGLTYLLVVADYTEFAGQLTTSGKILQVWTEIGQRGISYALERRTVMKALLFAFCVVFSTAIAKADIPKPQQPPQRTAREVLHTSLEIATDPKA